MLQASQPAMADAQPKKKRARVPDAEAPAPSSAPVVKDHNKYRCVLPCASLAQRPAL